jgi:hypothetical protein
MTWQEKLNGDSLTWLLEKENPGVRYLALRDLVNLPPGDSELLAAKELAHRDGQIAAVLDKMQPEGYWVKPGAGYAPKYRGTVWSLILLSQLGADVTMDERIQKACNYYLENGLTSNGQFSISGAPSGTVDCLQGNMGAALLALGCTDSRLAQAYDWMARSVTGEGIAPFEDKKAPLRYYSGKIGPDFACGANNKLACAWGAVKAMSAFALLPEDKYSSQIERAVERGIDFLFSVDPATAAYPTGYADKPSGNWFKFGFPLFYVTDVLQLVESLVLLGYGKDSRLDNVFQLILEKQDADGRWGLEYGYAGKTWVDFGEKKAPNNWVTLRALKVLKESC